MRIYKIKVTYETVIAAACEEEAEINANSIIREADENPKSIKVEAIPTPNDLPKDWSLGCIPWGCEEDKPLREHFS